MDDLLRVAMEAAVLLIGVAMGWATMRAQTAQARRDAAEAQEGADGARRAVGQLEGRVIALERDMTHHGRKLEESLGRVEASVSALHTRLDGLLVEGLLQSRRAQREG